ncbi:MAG: Rid family detoxifying hydrolase [Dehalococcoidia bacterium]|nr:Rid family detoxifying hydrolase [Dehalococcoidia bacterium]
MIKKIVATSAAPAAIGPYSQAIVAQGFVFVSGQIPIDPATGSFVEGGIAAQTRQVLSNLEAVLEASGSSLTDVVKTTVFMADLADFAAMNAVFGEFFPSDPPARAALQAAALPRGALVEIEAIANCTTPLV